MRRFVLVERPLCGDALTHDHRGRKKDGAEMSWRVSGSRKESQSAKFVSSRNRGGEFQDVVPAPIQISIALTMIV
jgi:hypothetical protein